VKRVAVFTLNDYKNYGNRLQNYAVYKILSSLGCDAKTVILRKNKRFLQRIKQILGNSPVEVWCKLLKNILLDILVNINAILNTENSRIATTREDNFKRFTQKYSPTVDYGLYDPEKNIYPKELTEDFDYFVVGSDQVWNLWNGLFPEPVNFLPFAPKEKCISFAASFGYPNVHEHLKAKFSKCLSGIGHISVREESGAKIVRELTGADALVVADPTMTLNKEEWLEIATIPDGLPDKPYLLTFFLGNVTKQYSEIINEVTGDNRLELIKLNDKRDTIRYTAPPDEFLGYINNAEIVFTDSFHCLAFSILFGKPFVAFERKGEEEKMFTRIENLLKLVKMESRTSNKVRFDETLFDLDFSEANKIIESERRKSVSFIENTLEIEKLIMEKAECN